METMYFGRHRGQRIDEIPTDYIAWGAGALKGGVKRQFEDELARRTGQPIPQRSSAGLGTFDCSHLYRPDVEVPGLVAWDGVSPPWCDQNGSGELDREYREIIG